MNSAILLIIKNELTKNVGFEVVIEDVATIKSRKIKL